MSNADTPKVPMQVPHVADFRTGRTGRPRNGMPEERPYRYGGSGRSLTPAESARRLRIPPQVLLPPEARLDVCEAIDGPSPEWRREAAQEIRDLALTGRALPPAAAPSLATSREMRAAVPVPTVIKLRVVQEPICVNGRHRAWRGPMPPSLAARLAATHQPATPPGDGRCDRCGYKVARCCCPGGPRGGAA